MRTEIGPWLVEYDPDTTRNCYARIPWGEDCECSPCRNLDVLDPTAFPASILDVFDRFGIDFHKPAEVFHISPLENGLHDYGGWYHFVGLLVSGPEIWQPELASSTSYAREAGSLVGRFSIWCSSKRDLAAKAFGELPLVQIDFSAQLPWVLDEPEPT